MSACAITDHGVLSGAINFYKAAKKNDIKPLLAMEAYCTADKDGLENKDKTRDNFHLVLIAMNEIGWSNLIRLNNYAYLDNFYYKPRICLEHLGTHNEGLIATSACLGGLPSKMGIYSKGKNNFTDPDKYAEEQLVFLKKIFKDRFYAEVQDHPFWEQKAYNEWLIPKAKELDIPIIITSDAHFLTKKDYDTHKIIIAKNTGKTLASQMQDDDGLFYYKTHHVRTAKNMWEAANKWEIPEAIDNTIEIGNRCNVELKLGEYKYPQFDITKKEDYQDFVRWKENEKRIKSIL